MAYNNPKRRLPKQFLIAAYFFVGHFQPTIPKRVQLLKKKKGKLKTWSTGFFVICKKLQKKL